jgi:phosphosulfolactate synthase (CoM biosynthesis protein A)
MRANRLILVAFLLITGLISHSAIVVAEGDVANDVRDGVRAVDKDVDRDAKDVDEEAKKLGKEQHKEDRHLDKEEKKHL